MKTVNGFILVLITAAMLLSGCAALQEFVQPPSVRISGVRLADVSFEQLGLDVDLAVRNPNTFGFSMDGFDYSMSIEGKEFLSGTQEKQLMVEAKNSQTLQIPLSVNLRELHALSRAVQEQDSLTYSITGHLFPSGVFSGTRIPFDHSGRLPNVRIPHVSFDGLKVLSMGLGGIDLQLGLSIDNPNSFGFNLSEMDYSIDLAGSRVASGKTQKAFSVGSKEESTLTLPISLGFTELGSSLRSMLKSNSIEIAISSSTVLDSPLGSMKLPLEMTQEVDILK